jgi:hypothetical protein
MFDRGYQISRRCCFLSQYLQHLARKKKKKQQSAPVMNRKSENRSKRVKNGTGFHKKSPKESYQHQKIFTSFWWIRYYSKQLRIR